MTQAVKAKFGQHVPDILDCLAQLSNDEVPTPPKLARAMLDILPTEVWGKPDYRWLDPCSKSGVFPARDRDAPPRRPFGLGAGFRQTPRPYLPEHDLRDIDHRR